MSPLYHQVRYHFSFPVRNPHGFVLAQFRGSISSEHNLATLSFQVRLQSFKALTPDIWRLVDEKLDAAVQLIHMIIAGAAAAALLNLLPVDAEFAQTHVVSSLIRCRTNGRGALRIDGPAYSISFRLEKVSVGGSHV